MLPRSGDLVRITAAASVQFGGGRGFPFRVIRTLKDWPCDNGWVWLDGYQLTPAGDAVEQRRIYVMLGGLRWATLRHNQSPPGSSPRRPPPNGAGPSSRGTPRNSPPRGRSGASSPARIVGT